MDILLKQPRIINLLKRAIANNKLSHAYLFAGESGTGQKEVAHWLAKVFFCKSEEKPCGSCSTCLRIASGNFPDVIHVQAEGQTIKIEQIRELQKEFRFKGVESAKKCYIISDVEKMSVQAANSLLKFLEEPNEDVLAILLTDNKNQLLDTILSRVQSYYLDNVKIESEELMEQGLTKEQAFFLSEVTRQSEVISELLADNWYQEAYTLFENTLHEISHEPELAALVFGTEWGEVFNDKNKQAISIQLLITFFEQLVFYQCKRPIELTDMQELLITFAEIYNLEKSLSILDNLIEEKSRLKSNGHYISTLEGFSHVLIA